MYEDFVKVYTCSGQLDADMIKIFLESMQLHPITSRESAGGVYGLSVGPLGKVDILVPENEGAEAADILRRMEAGEFEDKSQQ